MKNYWNEDWNIEQSRKELFYKFNEGCMSKSDLAIITQNILMISWFEDWYKGRGLDPEYLDECISEIYDVGFIAYEQLTDEKLGECNAKS